MNSDTQRNPWPRVRRVLEEALEHPTRLRSAFVEEACGSDLALRAEVEHLLTFEPTAETLFDAPLTGAARIVFDEADAQACVGASIGAYRLTGLIARGGMGTVYRAARADDHFDKEVAIKILTASIRSPQSSARFHRERQILAKLEHPNITRLIDGGTTADGRPYIVMEYVHGEPVTRHARQHGLDLRERLHLFARVCQAVQFAHQNLIVHRDLKPANILVTESGDVKLLDFGISKLLESDSADLAAVTTATVAAPMTMRYCSPEQVSGGLITTATDTYSLGVLLYELLTDQLPYEPGSNLQGAAATICDTIPRPPSELRPELNREIDAIVLHALEKEPARRYPTVEALAEDIERYLDGQAVLAHSPTRWYFVRKAAWRHRWPLALAATVLVLVIGFALAATSLALRLASEKSAAIAAGQRETHARQNAEQINTFLAETLISADPLLGGRPDLSLLELLEDAKLRLESDFVGDADAKAALHLTLGRAYVNLWMLSDAQPHLTQAITAHRRTNEQGQGLADALEAMADLHMLELSYAAAESGYRECLEIQRTLPGPRGGLSGETDDRVAAACLNLARSLAANHRSAEAEQLLREALSILREAHGQNHEKIADALDQLAKLHVHRDEPGEAESLHARAMQIRRALFGDRHEVVAAGLEAGAELHDGMGNHATAMQLYDASLEMRDSLLGLRHPSSIQLRLHAGFTALKLVDFEKADRLMADAVDIARTSLPQWHRTLRYARSVYGLFLNTRGRYEEAEPLMLAAYEGTVRLWGEEHVLVAHLRRHLGAMYHAWGRPESAAKYADPGDAPSVRQGRCTACGFGFGAIDEP